MGVLEEYLKHLFSAVDRHFPGETERSRLFTACHVKNRMMMNLADSTITGNDAESFLHYGGILANLHKRLPRAGASIEEMQRYLHIEPEAMRTFETHHHQNPIQFGEVLRTHFDQAASSFSVDVTKRKASTGAAIHESVGDVKPAVASWASRLVRDEAGKVHGGRVAALAAGGVVAGAGAVALLHHRHEAKAQKAQEPSSGRG